ncbi:MAG: TonB-dependent receptor [Deltaproteobacteria bacterium]|nr:MAG: TonB-dependent receptor [Deltaproteobacteria bacterium]
MVTSSALAATVAVLALAHPARAQAPDPAPPAQPQDPPPAPPAPEQSATTTRSDQPAADAKVTLRGTVTGEDHAPQPGAGVSITALGLYVFTDEKGEYTLSVPPGPHVVRVEMAGQLPVEKTVIAGATSTAVDFQLAEGSLGEVITIVGSRTPRSRLETPVPVDVITSDVISESSHTELNQMLNVIAPSFNAAHLAIVDGTDHIDPADLRGLGPEHVLVLVNGKRLHQSSLINVYNLGTVGVDLNAIPTAAIARIEVLRDGAASQYGSDAIAGVINIVLKDNIDVVDLYTMTGITGSGDGAQFKLGGNTGFKLGDRGFANVTGEFFARGRTNRAGAWEGDIFPGASGAAETDQMLASKGLTRDDFKMGVGQSGALVGTGVLNAGYRLDHTFTLHAQGSYTLRKGYASGFYRFPADEDQVDLHVYPNGFLPQINPMLNAWTATGGVRGKTGPWEGDLSLTYGGDNFHFFVDHSLNASLGAMSPTSFDAGQLNFRQTSVNLDGVRRIDQKALKALSVVGGAELRHENYFIVAGQPESYELGPELDSAGQPKIPGSQVFPGFQPVDASNSKTSRLSEAVYAGVESQPTAGTNADVGARFEHYSDFGSTLTGKIAGRVTVFKRDESDVAVRASASTGFRAPGVQQIGYSTIITNFTNDASGMVQPSNVLVSPNRSPVTEAFGVPRLKQETSVNLSGGVTARLSGNLAISADYYHVAIKDRIVLSGQFRNDDPTIGVAVADIVAPFPGVTAAQFFVNAVDTTTDGVDVVADYSYRLPRGVFKATAAVNLTQTTVDAVHVPQSMQQRFSSVDGGPNRVAEVFLGRFGRNALEDLLPRQKGTLGLRWDYAGWSAGLRANYFGPTEFHSDGGKGLDESFGEEMVFDVDVGYRIGGIYLSVGANNVFNIFPDQVRQPDNRYFESFLYAPASNTAGAPFGIAGGFYYLRAEYHR